MALTSEEIRELSQLLDAREGRGRSERPKLRLITPPTSTLLDPLARDAHLRRILHLQRAYRLHWLVDQATFDVAGLSCLEDCDLIRLLTDMERARECIADGVSMEDAGLVRSVLDRSPGELPPPSRKEIQQMEHAAIGVSRLRPHAPAANAAAPDGEPPF